MQALEKILEEIEEAARQEDAPIYCGDMEVDGYVRMSVVCDIIRKHMNDGWIPVEERLPEDGQTVLCTDGEYVYLVEYDADLDAPFGDLDGIIAWHPLPKPYHPETKPC